VAEELVIGGKPRHRRGTVTAIALIAGGALAGGILASTVGASASSSTPAAEAAVSSPAPGASSPAPGKGNKPNFAARLKQLTGTVTAVGSDTIGIKTSTATTTYSVTSTSRISINESGPGALSGVKVGDTVFFSTTTDGGTVIADLRDGNVGGPGFGGQGGPGRGGPGGPGLGGFAGVRPLTGTVTAVGTDTVGIKTSTATTTYSVTSTTHIEKNGKAALADVKVGDTVFFATTTTGGTVIANLFDGKLPTAAIGGHGPGGLGFGGRTGGGSQAPAASPSASASTVATNT